MKIVDELRHHIKRYWESWEVERGRLLKFCDEIEHEIAETYMPLPLDMNGEPIRIGDTVRELGDKVPMKVMSLAFYEDCVDVNTCGMNPNLLMHVKPRTVEDVLSELIADSKVSDETIAKYADELRELMGGE